MTKEIIIKVDNQNIQLNPSLSIPLKQTNVPREYLMFRTHEEISWKVELLDYNPDAKRWKMKVVDYYAQDNNNFRRQTTSKEVKEIIFEKFDWSQLAGQLVYFQKSRLHEYLYNNEDPSYPEEDPKHKIFRPVSFNESEPKQQEIKILTQEITVTIPFSKSRFICGYVTFKKWNTDFEIKNDHILAEFETIKSWFAKKFKRKTFDVFLTITITNDSVTEVVATSPQIALINSELVDSIKYQLTISLTKAPKSSQTDKSLFSIEEVFKATNADNNIENIFKQSEQDIMDILINTREIRNKKQLEYLSGIMQSKDSKIKFTLSPLFGFLFLIEGLDNNHFVWELLNSHATYIWSINKSESEIDHQYKRIENSINTIRKNGRESYKDAYRKNSIDNDLTFCIITHQIDGFTKWRNDLSEKLN